MATTVDRVINQYELIDRYSAKLDAMSRKTSQFADKVNRIQRNLLKFGVTTVGTAGAGLLAFGKSAVDAAVRFELLETTLNSLTKNATRTAEQLDFAKKLAGPANFTFEELAQAGTQLQGFNVPFERTLLLIAKLGAAFPNKELQDFVSLFGRLGAGDFPDIEALSGIGLSKLDFMKEGIKFDAQGSLLSSSRETMDALERLVNKRYGKILDDISKTTASKLSSVRDKWDEVLRKVGDALVKYVNPALDKLSNWLEKVGKNDGFEKMLKRAAVETLKFTMKVFMALGTLNVILGFLNASVKNYAGAFMNALGAIASFAGAAFLGIEGSKALKELFKMGNMPGGAGKVEVPPIPGTGQDFPNNPALKTLNDIEGNTKATAENTSSIDFKRYGLGGGDIAGMGIQAIDRYKGRSMDRNRSITINAGKDKMSQAIAEVARQVYEQMNLQTNGGR